MKALVLRVPELERSRDKSRGGQPGHPGHGLVRDPEPQRERVDPPADCRGCGSGRGCGTTTTAAPPSGGLVNGISYGPVLNTAAIALTAFGNVPTERAAHLVGMLTGQQVSAGLVDKANARLAAQLTGAGFAEAMQAALLAEPVLTADESPVEVVTPAKDPKTGQPVPGAPHVMVLFTRTNGWYC